jgi:hypothetical protein
VGSESSSRILLERLVHKDLHGMLPSVSYCTKAALERLDPMPKKEPTLPPGACRRIFVVDFVFILAFWCRVSVIPPLWLAVDSDITKSKPFKFFSQKNYSSGMNIEQFWILNYWYL